MGVAQSTKDKNGSSTSTGNVSSTTSARIAQDAAPQLAGGRARFLILVFFLCCPLAVFATISITKSPLFAFSFVWWFGVWYELTQTWKPAGKRKGLTATVIVLLRSFFPLQ